jgi:hypothetical protein
VHKRAIRPFVSLLHVEGRNVPVSSFVYPLSARQSNERNNDKSIIFFIIQPDSVIEPTSRGIHSPMETVIRLEFRTTTVKNLNASANILACC